MNFAGRHRRAVTTGSVAGAARMFDEIWAVVEQVPSHTRWDSWAPAVGDDVSPRTSAFVETSGAAADAHAAGGWTVG